MSALPGPSRRAPRPVITELPETFARKVRESTCLVWVGATNSRGYGVVIVNGHQELAHRVAYEAHFGPIPDGHVLDHLCRVRNCVRPEHLEPVSHAENQRRRSDAQTHCKWGHEYTAANTVVARNGWRTCRACRISARERRLAA